MIKSIYDPSQHEGPMNVAAFLSGSGTNVMAVYEEQKRLEQEDIEEYGKIYVAFTHVPNCKGAYRVENETDIPLVKFSSKKFADLLGMKPTDEEFRRYYDAATIEQIEIFGKPDLIIGVGWWRIWSDLFVERYQNRILHDHPANPFIYSGLYGIDVPQEAIRRKSRYINPVVQFVSPGTGVDSGPVLIESKSIPILEEDTPESLWERSKEQGDWRIYPFAVHHLIARGRVGMDEENNLYVDGVRMPREGYQVDKYGFNYTNISLGSS